MLHNSSSHHEAMHSGHADGRSLRVVAILPCHNRDRFIGSALIKLQHYVDRVIVVNDGSTDHTGIVARQAGAEVIDYPTRQRPGVAIEHGLTRALELGADVLVLLEGDAQMIPEQVPSVLRPILQDDVDIVIGTMVQNSRRPGMAGSHPLEWGRRVSLVSADGGLRAFTEEAFVACGMSPARLATDTSSVGAGGLRALEVPIVQPRETQPVRRLSVAPQDTLLKLFGKAGPVRLLLLLATSGLLLTALGIVFWYQTVEIFAARSQLALGHALLGTLAVTVGIMIAFEALTLHVIRRLVQMPRRQTGDC